jgi:hypothetical protein
MKPPPFHPLLSPSLRQSRSNHRRPTAHSIPEKVPNPPCIVHRRHHHFRRVNQTAVTHAFWLVYWREASFTVLTRLHRGGAPCAERAPCAPAAQPSCAPGAEAVGATTPMDGCAVGTYTLFDICAVHRILYDDRVGLHLPPQENSRVRSVCYTACMSSVCAGDVTVNAR